jgi:hypothetical protein
MEEHALNFSREPETPEAVQDTLRRWVKSAIEAMEARRFDPGPRQDPDYERILREREGQMDELVEQINKIAREQEPGFRGNYTEGEKNTWKDWILGLVGLMIVGWLGRISYQMEELQGLLAKQEITDQRLNRLEQRVYRGSP